MAAPATLSPRLPAPSAPSTSPTWSSSPTPATTRRSRRPPSTWTTSRRPTALAADTGYERGDVVVRIPHTHSEGTLVVIEAHAVTRRYDRRGHRGHPGAGGWPGPRLPTVVGLARAAITATTKPMTFSSQMLPVPSTFVTSPQLEALEHTFPDGGGRADLHVRVDPGEQSIEMHLSHSHLTLGKPAPPARLCVPDTAVSWWIGSACEQVTLLARRSQRGYVLATSLLPAVQVR